MHKRKKLVMEEYINEFLDYILKQKKYSSNTAKNYSIDIDEFKTYLKKEGVVQVTVNLTDYRVTPLWQVFDLVCREAERYGVEILESELIGLIPQDALTDCGAHYLKLKNFQTDRIFEKRL